MLKKILDLPQSSDVSLHQFPNANPFCIPHFPHFFSFFSFYFFCSEFVHAKGAFVVFMYTVVAAGDSDQGCRESCTL